VLDLFKPGQVHLMQYEGCKDANDMLVQRGPGAVRKAFWDAKPYRPDSIINLKDIREKVFERPSMGYTYPWSDLTEKTCGFHKGDLVTWTSGQEQHGV
jgi:twinkle protein